MLQYTDMDIYKREMNDQSTQKRVIGSILYQIKTGKITPDLDKCILKHDDIAHHINELKRKNRNEFSKYSNILNQKLLNIGDMVLEINMHLY